MITTNPEDAWISNIDRQRTLEKLTTKEQTLWALREQGYNNEEAAKHFGVAPSTVHYWWKKLQTKLQSKE